MKTLVTGAGGFIGSHLVRYLKDLGYWVRGVDIKAPEYWDSAAEVTFLAGPRLKTLLPEGVTPGAQVVDTLDSGLAFVDLVSVVPSAGVTVANTLLPLPSANVTVGSSGRVITYALGDITNRDQA